jgi:uncharacterized protein YbbC (DUF1343 family)
MFNNEKWLENGVKADLTIIKMENWKRNYLFSDCNLPWIAPSPNIPDLETAIIYPGMCLLEGLNISEGRGTYAPFLTIGAPFINSNEVLAELKKLDIVGIDIKPITFTPKSIENMSTSPKYKDVECNGLSLKITDTQNIKALRFGIKLLYSIHKLYPNNFEFRNNWLDKLFGNTNLTQMLKNNSTPEEIFSLWEHDLINFKTLRKNYLLYQ